ncbi:hypothetical protein TIFTF001_000665 [Ficus carica]|uniref:FAS1 domain-containing protein n=1 Tax=Ficus carica TaxID=3494 RepID=A0AA87Z342_FICCA|nr:hypothetical protein TIFTF001_000665 [Ficus carica]
MKQSLISFALILFLFLDHTSAALTQSPALAPSQDKPVQAPAQAPTKPAVQVQPPSQASPAQAPAEIPLVQAPSEVPLVEAPPRKAKPVPTNVTKILEKAGNFGMFIRILKNTQVINQIENQLNTANSLTILAPTNGAFSGLKAGTLNTLSTEQKVQLVQYHILPSFISLSNFQTLSNPVRTQASNSEEYPLNVTTEGNWVNITTGLVNTSISGTVYADNQLAIYKVDKVLLPLGIFAPKPKALAPAPALAIPDKGSSSSSSTSSSSSLASFSGDSPAAALNEASYGLRVARINGVVTAGVVVATIFLVASN